mgnify:FL=1
MSTIVAVYTGQGLSGPLQALFKEHLPDCRFVNIIDDSIINDINREGRITQSVKRRLFQYYQNAIDIGADIILNTCSSVGEVADAARLLIDTPLVKIDEPMADIAVSKHKKIGVIATLPSTLNPTIRLIKKRAELAGKDVEVVEGLAEGAYLALVNGKPEQHDELILKTAYKLADTVDGIVLAQGSMARMEKNLAEKTGKAVYSSPYYCVQYIKKMLGEMKNG